MNSIPGKEPQHAKEMQQRYDYGKHPSLLTDLLLLEVRANQHFELEIHTDDLELALLDLILTNN